METNYRFGGRGLQQRWSVREEELRKELRKDGDPNDAIRRAVDAIRDVVYDRDRTGPESQAQRDELMRGEESLEKLLEVVPNMVRVWQDLKGWPATIESPPAEMELRGRGSSLERDRDSSQGSSLLGRAGRSIGDLFQGHDKPLDQIRVAPPPMRRSVDVEVLLAFVREMLAYMDHSASLLAPTPAAVAEPEIPKDVLHLLQAIYGSSIDPEDPAGRLDPARLDPMQRIARILGLYGYRVEVCPVDDTGFPVDGAEDHFDLNPYRGDRVVQYLPAILRGEQVVLRGQVHEPVGGKKT